MVSVVVRCDLELPKAGVGFLAVGKARRLHLLGYAKRVLASVFTDRLTTLPALVGETHLHILYYVLWYLGSWLLWRHSASYLVMLNPWLGWPERKRLKRPSSGSSGIPGMPWLSRCSAGVISNNRPLPAHEWREWRPRKLGMQRGN